MHNSVELECLVRPNIPSPKELILARDEMEVKGKPNLKGI